MRKCPKCREWMPTKTRACPHCQHSESGFKKIMARITGFATIGFTSITLMACYGMPQRNQFCLDEVDKDNDGYPACTQEKTPESLSKLDCDDENPAIHPNLGLATEDKNYIRDEKGDGIDQDCDGDDGVAVPAP